jgi:hypothetical protein
MKGGWATASSSISVKKTANGESELGCLPNSRQVSAAQEAGSSNQLPNKPQNIKAILCRVKKQIKQD